MWRLPLPVSGVSTRRLEKTLSLYTRAGRKLLAHLLTRNQAMASVGTSARRSGWMPMTLSPRAQRYRDKAKELRDMAARVEAAEVRRELEELAESYEELAERFETLRAQRTN